MRGGGAYQDDGVACGHDDDVGAGDHSGAALLQRVLDLVDDLERAQGVDVGERILLAGHRRRGVHQHRAVAPLQPPPATGKEQKRESIASDRPRAEGGREGGSHVAQPERDQMRGAGGRAAHVDEAVVELEAHDGGDAAGLACARARHGLTDDVLGLRARLGVVPDLELPHRRLAAAEGREEHGDQGEPEAPAGDRHG